jgi:hypothetical protein
VWRQGEGSRGRNEIAFMSLTRLTCHSRRTSALHPAPPQHSIVDGITSGRRTAYRTEPDEKGLWGTRLGAVKRPVLQVPFGDTLRATTSLG